MTVVISLSLVRAHTHTFVYMYTCVHVRASVSFCLSVVFFSFFPPLLRTGARARERREKGNSMMMSILWHRAHIYIQKEREREKKAQQSVERKRERERTRITRFFFFSSVLYSVSSFLSSANCMYKQ